MFAKGPSCPIKLPRQDSNLETVIQSHVCYHYTTGQMVGRWNEDP